MTRRRTFDQLRNRFAPVLVLLCGAALAPAQNPPQAPAQPPNPQQAPAPQTAPQAAPPQVPIGSLTLNNVSLTEVVDQLAKQLGLNVLLDPRVKGSVTLNTYGELRGLDARNLLDMLLRINGAGMVQEGGIDRIVPLTDIAR